MEERTPGGNSGLFYRATEDEERPQWTAVEYQLLDSGSHPDGKNGADRWSGAVRGIRYAFSLLKSEAGGQNTACARNKQGGCKNLSGE